jgi:hypothetical protein
MAADPLDELGDVLHLLTPEELAEAERLLTPTALELLRALPDDVLSAVLHVRQQLRMYAGRESDIPSGWDYREDVVLFDEESGEPLPYEKWHYLASGKPVGDDCRDHLRWLPSPKPRRDYEQTDADVLALLPDSMLPLAAAVFAAQEREAAR